MTDLDPFWLALGAVTLGGIALIWVIEWRWPTPKPGDDDDDDWWQSIK